MTKKKTNIHGEELDIDFKGSHKPGRQNKNMTKLTNTTRERYGMQIPKPTMFDGMGEVEDE